MDIFPVDKILDGGRGAEGLLSLLISWIALSVNRALTARVMQLAPPFPLLPFPSIQTVCRPLSAGSLNPHTLQPYEEPVAMPADLAADSAAAHPAATAARPPGVLLIERCGESLRGRRE